MLYSTILYRAALCCTVLYSTGCTGLRGVTAVLCTRGALPLGAGAGSTGRRLPSERSGARQAPGTTKEVLFIIDFLDFNMDFLGFPILLGFPRIS